MNVAYLHLANSRWVESGYNGESARKVVEDTYAGHNNIAVGFGRHFLANPDLPFRLRHGIQLAPYDRETFYGPGSEGYTDYPFSSEFIDSH
ncbi:putative NADPH dehydrogenase C5H10.04 [Glarea lozoyensis 74030]|uniref:Putative NADPH dehydrogenase C5H10.04 n=1 Tax=Glarea lozoyensis (strain ATCC 74030 / MF5533) TaxID=1104152 RepID=H0ENS8_GLAL7|nr:putative NADPH dehydrogenase C5H10.04 [Glarea lozoyensis 74030]